ncbi:MAG: carbamoyltransferase HypF [Verrucomicrobiales bacterium]|nr:carbamoyltransferase HypF [Verrucomicrobiales bacterium]
MSSLEIHITGFVQGVGFRPAVYLIADELGLRGTVANTPDGVCIRCTTPDNLSAKSTLEQIQNKIADRGFNVFEYRCQDIALLDDSTFQIIPSTRGQASLFLPPDVGICKNCAQEWANSADRRHGYSFISCTQCGCRYTWMHRTPYDRESLTIDAFPQCKKCQTEYTDPRDRRFHAQTNTCPDCGPTLTLYSSQPNVLNISAIARSHELLRDQQIVAVKGVGGYLLTCDARSDHAVRRLREIKGRDAKPFAVLFGSEEELLQHYQPTDAELEQLRSPQRPIVLLEKPKDEKQLSPSVSGDLPHEGCFLAASSLLLSLASEFPLVATSANLSGEPILTTLAETKQRFAGKIGGVLDYNLDIHFPCDDSVVRVTKNQERIILRTGRGLAPLSCHCPLPGIIRQTLAMGAQERAGISCHLNRMLYTSGYIGDLENYDSQVRFHNIAERWLKLLDFEPAQIIVDQHPEYHSTILGRELAGKLGAEVIEVQHHEAHFASVLHENDLLDSDEPILGVIWDGSGMGSDQTIWGGEFFLYQQYGIKRFAHLQPVPLLCGERMVKEPKLSALAFIGHFDPNFEKHFDPREIDLLGRKLADADGIPCSSVGRLFDAAASILCGCQKNLYSGHAAIELETRAHHYLSKQGVADDLTLLPCGDDPISFDGGAMIAALTEAVQCGADRDFLAASFHLTLIEKIADIARAAGTRLICFSGGVFQNQLLCELAHERLAGEFQIYHHKNLSPGDDSISHGQIIRTHLHALSPAVKSSNSTPEKLCV